MGRVCARISTDPCGRKACSHVWLAQMLDLNTKQTFFGMSCEALEIARLREFMCPRWRAELHLVPAPAYIRVWLPVLQDRVLNEFGQIFRTRPNLVRSWAPRLPHIYGAITHQFGSLFAVEGRSGARLLVYQDRDVKQLNVFWPLLYYPPGQEQQCEAKLEYFETRWATINPSYAECGRTRPVRRPSSTPGKRDRDDPWSCYCQTERSCGHSQKKHCACCKCFCHKTETCPCQFHSRPWCWRCSCHLHQAHCKKVHMCRCQCHEDEILERGWTTDFK